jgi:hypothetical protein
MKPRLLQSKLNKIKAAVLASLHWLPSSDRSKLRSSPARGGQLSSRVVPVAVGGLALHHRADYYEYNFEI